MPASSPAKSSSTLPGGKYRWSVNADGRYSIYDVPIFGEVPAGEKGNDKPLGISYMFQAVTKAFARKREGYMSAVHIEHHDPFNSSLPSYAGLLDIKRVGKVTYQGKPMHSIFADIVNMPESVATRIMAGEIPYRSVELPPDTNAPPEICSLALMSTTTPFFRLPMTTMGEQVPDQNFSASTMSTPCVGTHGRFVLFDFKSGGSQMADDAEKKPDEKKPEDEKKPDEKLQDAPAPAGDEMKAACQAIADGQSQILAVLAKIAEGLGLGAGAPATPAPEGAGSAQPPAMHLSLEPVMKTLGNLTGSVSKLEKDAATRAKKDSDDTLFAAQIKRLEAYEITDAMKQRVRDACQYGEKAVTLMVDGILETGIRPDGANTFSALPVADDKGSKDALAKYANDPAQHEKARKILGFYAEARDHGLLAAADREKPDGYIERNMRLAEMGMLKV